MRASWPWVARGGGRAGRFGAISAFAGGEWPLSAMLCPCEPRRVSEIDNHVKFLMTVRVVQALDCACTCDRRGWARSCWASTTSSQEQAAQYQRKASLHRKSAAKPLALELEIFRTCAKTEGKDDSIGGIDVPYRIWHVDCVRANQSDV